MTVPLRERLVEIIMDAAGWKRGKQGAGIIADALLAAEEWTAREAVVEAARDHRDHACVMPHYELDDALARLDAGKEEGR